MGRPPHGFCFGVRPTFPYGMTMLPQWRTHELSNRLWHYNKLVLLQIGASCSTASWMRWMGVPVGGACTKRAARRVRRVRRKPRRRCEPHALHKHQLSVHAQPHHLPGHARRAGAVDVHDSRAHRVVLLTTLRRRAERVRVRSRVRERPRPAHCVPCWQRSAVGRQSVGRHMYTAAGVHSSQQCTQPASGAIRQMYSSQPDSQPAAI